MSVVACPDWCTTDHTSDSGLTLHHTEPKIFGSNYEEVGARLELIEGATDGSNGNLVHIWLPGNGEDGLRMGAAREFARQLVEWADMVETQKVTA